MQTKHANVKYAKHAKCNVANMEKYAMELVCDNTQ